MRHYLYLAAALLLATTAAHAQVFNPDNLIGKPPAPPTHTHATPTDNLQWLWQYTQPNSKPTLLADPRFPTLLKENLIAPQAFWGNGIPLNEAAATFLAGPGTIASADNRHLTITGCVPDHCPQRGLLWLDLGRTSPLVIFAALRWNEQSRSPDEPAAPFTLYLFPNHDLDPRQLPDALKSSLATWTASCPDPAITSVILIDPNGTPHILGKLEAGLTPTFCPSNSKLQTPHSKLARKTEQAQTL
jgi:hypothetical protein